MYRNIKLYTTIYRDKISDTYNINFVILRYTVENSVEIEEKFKVFNKHLLLKPLITRGLLYKSVE